MARARNLRDGQTDLKWIWDLEFAVGPGCANRPDDVQLVQHVINTVSATLGLTKPDGSALGYLKRDGLFGPKTKTAIEAYQKLRKSSGKLIKPDGMVSPSSATGWTKDGNAQFTIVYLNRDHLKTHGKMMDEKDFPEPLQTKARTTPTVER
jgi:peptidoglycan hydrolase-like protein with peptidoglycan-binding domain